MGRQGDFGLISTGPKRTLCLREMDSFPHLFLMKRRYLRLVRRIFRSLRHPRIRRSPRLTALTKRLFERDLWKPCRHTVAGGLSIGLFFAMSHIPLQSLVAAFFAMRLRVNIVFAVMGTWVTNPVTTLAIAVYQHKFGRWCREAVSFEYPAFLDAAELRVGGVVFHFGDLLLGCVLSGLILGGLAYPVVHVIGGFIPHHHLPRRRVRTMSPAEAARKSANL